MQAYFKYRFPFHELQFLQKYKKSNILFAKYIALRKKQCNILYECLMVLVLKQSLVGKANLKI